ncbi:hypothetical protein ACFSQD_18830 [Flavihumibacter stibioxidans]|uniref:Uncharacterized protein n=1 Tax=Flavihumibacter stibioxidans TaxID=1834163 RepID=A0ABR7MD23_9BACT|nr:hypothetical protein [Flavihumibacter stibioxidans]MBC6492531.1 hypothetical protein [Flavihumibacter stibioxidans]
MIAISGHINRMILLIAVVAFFSSAGYSQRYDWRTRIDDLVQVADSLSMHSQQTFYLNKFIRNDLPVRETWHYTLHNERVIIFEIHYFIDSSEFQEVYYLDRDQVVCMEQYQILYPQLEEDRILWGTVGFFQGNSLRQYITMGRPPAPTGFSREWDAIGRFRDRYKELLAHRPLQERKHKGTIFVP